MDEVPVQSHILHHYIINWYYFCHRYYAWDYRFLRKFARHCSSGEEIPQKLVELMQGAKKMFAATDLQRQVFFFSRYFLSFSCALMMTLMWHSMTMMKKRKTLNPCNLLKFPVRSFMPQLIRTFMGSSHSLREILALLLLNWKENIQVGNMWKAHIGRPDSVTFSIMEQVNY